MKRDLRTSEKRKAGYEILSYLIKHPASGDTVEGIAQWWLLERKIESRVEQVKQALAELVAKGWVLEHKMGDSRTHYRINQKKYAAIQALLTQRSR